LNKQNSGTIPNDFLFLFFFLIIISIAFGSSFDRIDNWFHDYWLNLRLKFSLSSEESIIKKLFPRSTPSREIILAIVDDKSILGIPGLFEGNRSHYATAIRNISANAPAVIGLDVFFASGSSDSEGDIELTEAVKNAGNVVVKAFRREDRKMTLPFPGISRYGFPAPSYFRSHRGEAIRSISMKLTTESGKNLLSFQAELFQRLLSSTGCHVEFAKNSIVFKTENKKITFPLTNGEFMWMNYDNPTRAYQTVSFYDVFNNSFPAGAFKDKIVIIGHANSMTEEKLYTPFRIQEFSPFLNALALRNMLNETVLIPPNRFHAFATAFIILAVFLFLIFPNFNPFASSLTAIFAIFALIATSLTNLMFYQRIFDIGPAIVLLIIAMVYTIARRYYMEQSEKLRIRNAFQHYVTPAVVNEILRNPEKLNLHGEEKNLTVFFSDIEGFTTISEGMAPLEVVSILNEYLSEMTEIIFKFDGLLDKYEGDAIMAVFGAPVDQKDHAVRACRCALANQRALKSLREKWKSENKPEIKARIGINTGKVVVGNMGSRMRFDYTVIGDNVNLAARLETANKIMHTEILVSEATAELAESAVISRCLGKLKVAGKNQHVKVYEVLADKLFNDKNYLDAASSQKNNYEKALACLEQRKFIEADQVLQEHLAAFPEDKPSQLLLSRVKGFLIIPPPQEWDFLVTQESK